MDQRRDLRRVHLAVGIDLDDDVGAAARGVTHAGHEGAADALVDVVHQHDDARIVAAMRHGHAGAFRTAVVDHDDQLDLGADARDHIENAAGGAKGWDDDAVHWLGRSAWGAKFRAPQHRPARLNKA